VTQSHFDPIAVALRDAVLAWYASGDQQLEGNAGRNTLETNSGFVERRGAPLLAMLAEHAGVESLEGRELVDLGAGFGALSVYFAASGATVTAVDVNASRLEVGAAVARSFGLPVRFMHGYMEALDLPAARFDLAVQNNSLCYLVDRGRRGAALGEALRVLVPGGWLIQRNPNRWTPLDPFTSLPLVHFLPPAAAERFALLVGRRRSSVRLMSPRAARQELRAAGFRSVIHAHAPGGGKPLRLLARYQHFLAQRPPDAEAPR
jgi:ubiquinone/menaquinone biosynthesis C-methylase UbiE